MPKDEREREDRGDRDRDRKEKKEPGIAWSIDCDLKAALFPWHEEAGY